MGKIRVMVTGAGSGVGQGIIKALRISKLDLTIISADISPLNTALYRADEAVIIPKVEEEGAFNKLCDIFKDKKINVLMVGSEFDLEFFSINKEKFYKDTGVLVAASPIETVKIAGDKWRTAKFLKDNGLPYASSVIPSGLEDGVQKLKQFKLPVIIKDRFGTSSRNVHVIRSEEQFIKLYDEVPNPIIQEFINKAELNNEYTCSIFKSKEGTLLGPFTAKRTLRSGSSWVIEVGEYKEVEQIMKTIGELLPIIGSLNVQIMMGESGPIPFEFNARFSGTTAVRANFGFNEPEMLLRNYYLNEAIALPTISKGVAFRYLEEVFIEGKTIADLFEGFPKGEIRNWF